MMLDYVLYTMTIFGLTGIMVTAFFYSSVLRNRLLLVLFLIAIVGLFGSIYSLLGNAVPLNAVTRAIYAGTPKATIRYVELREGVSILLLMELPGRDEPLWVRMPWSKPVAERLTQLQNAAALTQAQGNTDSSLGDLVVDRPFDSSYEDRPNDFKHERPTVRGPNKQY